MIDKKLLYNDNYFRYLFILLRHGSMVTRRRIVHEKMIFVEYQDRVRFAILNDKNKNRLIVFCYLQQEGRIEYDFIGEMRIFGYYPKQVRKILYYKHKEILEDGEFRERLSTSTVVISKKRARSYKRWLEYRNSSAR